MHVSLSTELSIEECRERLKQRLGPVRSRLGGGYEGDAPLIGCISGTSFTVRKCIKYRNSFAPVFYGTMVEKPGGTSIQGVFRPHPSMAIVLAFCTFVIPLSFGSPLCPVYWLATFMTFVAFGLIYLVLRRSVSRHYHSKLIREFLEETLNASTGSEGKGGVPSSIRASRDQESFGIPDSEVRKAMWLMLVLALVIAPFFCVVQWRHRSALAALRALARTPEVVQNITIYYGGHYEGDLFRLQEITEREALSEFAKACSDSVSHMGVRGTYYSHCWYVVVTAAKKHEVLFNYRPDCPDIIIGTIVKRTSSSEFRYGSFESRKLRRWFERHVESAPRQEPSKAGR